MHGGIIFDEMLLLALVFVLCVWVDDYVFVCRSVFSLLQNLKRDTNIG